MKIEKSIFRWDEFSDQPATLDRRAKRRIRTRGIRGVLKDWTGAFFLPLPVLRTLVRRRSFQPYYNDDGIGLCVNLERPFSDKKVLSAPEILAIVRPLNLRRIAIRIPLWDIDNLQDYVDFIRQFPAYRILVVILQDRRTIENPGELEGHLERIFESLSDLVCFYQIGNAVNRLKWGFVSQEEWFEFFRIAWNLRNRKFPEIKLLGGTVIDFDPLDHCRSLHNGFAMEYDGYAALLYVDRRGAPENRQMGFDLVGKIELLSEIMKGSSKLAPARSGLWITEVNWPIRDTGPHSPALGASQVGEVEQLHYLVRYYLLALATGKVEACYWHQLVAPGYGLIDNRGATVRERAAFRGFATLCRLFNGARIERFSTQDELGHYQLTARKEGNETVALWCHDRETTIPMPVGKQYVDIEGRASSVTAGQPVTIGGSVIYLVDG